MTRPKLVIVTGPTGSGKSDLAVSLARHLGCHIVGADSRQIYRGMPIGTAAPTHDQLAAVPHHMVGILDLHQSYSAADFETDVLNILPGLFQAGQNIVVMCGGSMMYIDAVCHGLDDLPTVDATVRNNVLALYENGGLDALTDALRTHDPEYLRTCADPRNHRRLAHALEITIQAGRPYSSMRTSVRKSRPFDVVKMYIDHPRDELFARINARVDRMISDGLVDEARRLLPLRHLNALNTVGYKEMFAYFDGAMTLPEAIARMAKNTRVYAKKQLTWLAKAGDAVALPPTDAYHTALKLLET